jgi:hypothetical protein
MKNIFHSSYQPYVNLTLYEGQVLALAPFFLSYPQLLLSSLPSSDSFTCPNRRASQEPSLLIRKLVQLLLFDGSEDLGSGMGKLSPGTFSLVLVKVLPKFLGRKFLLCPTFPFPTMHSEIPIYLLNVIRGGPSQCASFGLSLRLSCPPKNG